MTFVLQTKIPDRHILLYLLGEQVNAINLDLHILDKKYSTNVTYEELEQSFQEWCFQVGACCHTFLLNYIILVITCANQSILLYVAFYMFAVSWIVSYVFLLYIAAFVFNYSIQFFWLDWLISKDVFFL